MTATGFANSRMDPSAIRLVTLDLDDTLWDNRPVIEAAERALHDWLRTHRPRLAATHPPERLRDLRLALVEDHPHLRHDLTSLRIAGLERAARDSGCSPTEASQLAARAFEVFHHARQRVRLYSDVLPALRILSRRYRLAALTNGNADIERIGIAAWFEFSLSSADVGASKPDPAFFRAACRRAEVAPAQVLHVGDDPEKDLAGARAAGLRGLLLDRGGGAATGRSDRGAAPHPSAEDTAIASLSELVDALGACST